MQLSTLWLYLLRNANANLPNVNWEAVGIIVSIVGGALAMAWRLGGVERNVKDVGLRVDRIERKLDQDITPRSQRIERKIDQQDRDQRRRDRE